MIEGVVASLKIIAAIFGLWLAYKVAAIARSFYQKYIDAKREKEAAEARARAQDDTTKYEPPKVPRP